MTKSESLGIKVRARHVFRRRWLVLMATLFLLFPPPSIPLPASPCLTLAARFHHILLKVSTLQCHIDQQDSHLSLTQNKWLCVRPQFTSNQISSTTPLLKHKSSLRPILSKLLKNYQALSSRKLLELKLSRCPTSPFPDSRLLIQAMFPETSLPLADFLSRSLFVRQCYLLKPQDRCRQSPLPSPVPVVGAGTDITQQKDLRVEVSLKPHSHLYSARPICLLAPAPFLPFSLPLTTPIFPLLNAAQNQNQNLLYPWIPEFGLYPPPDHLDLESNAYSAKNVNPVAVAIAAGPARHAIVIGSLRICFGAKELNCAYAAGTVHVNVNRGGAEGQGVWESWGGKYEYHYHGASAGYYAAASVSQDRIYIYPDDPDPSRVDTVGLGRRGLHQHSLPIPASDFEDSPQVETSNLGYAQPFFVNTTIPTHEDSELSSASEFQVSGYEWKALAFCEIQTPASFEKPPNSTRAREGDSTPLYAGDDGSVRSESPGSNSEIDTPGAVAALSGMFGRDTTEPVMGIRAQRLAASGAIRKGRIQRRLNASHWGVGNSLRSLPSPGIGTLGDDEAEASGIACMWDSKNSSCNSILLFKDLLRHLRQIHGVARYGTGLVSMCCR
ncbi:hypothetical protein R3P38DRAFT_3201571 [Favolaschia claudopus]|uniref:C2H2-type domain-containing protein n=1 Tax=Favolaschia claudopus TaxID=2862362 RepID=A0AAW0AVD1_9AGAR